MHRASHEQSSNALSHEPLGFARALGLLSSELTARVNESEQTIQGSQSAQVDAAGKPGPTVRGETRHIISTSAKQGLRIDVDKSPND